MTLQMLQEAVERKLIESGLKVYFIAFEFDDGNPYFAYTFDKDLLIEAKEDWEQGILSENCYDDYTFEEDFESQVKDICFIIKDKYFEENAK